MDSATSTLYTSDGLGGISQRSGRKTTQAAPRFPPFDPHAIPAQHDLSYLEGPPPLQSQSTDKNSGTEPRRYFQGLASNARLLGISKAALLDSNAKSPFATLVSATSDHSHLPVSLQPTIISHRYPHHPFFDCIPLPAFRDRAILAGATNPPLINRFDLCYDMFAGGLTYDGDPTIEANWTYSSQFRTTWAALLQLDTVELERRIVAGQ